MTLITYPLDDCDYSADDAALFHCTRTSGIFASDDFSFSVSGADNTVSVSPGIAWMRINKFKGLVAALKNEASVDLGLPDSVYPRIDRVVLQYNANTRDTTVVVKRGVPRSNPIPPDRSTEEALYELHLLEVLRKPAAAAVKQENVTDLRFDSSCCGLMADSVTQVDTSAINAQVMALISELRTKLKDVESESIYTVDYQATLPASGWTGSGPYTQTVTVAGLTDGRRCMVYPAYGDDIDANLAMREACACVSYAKRSGSNVTITCLEDKPAVDVSIIVEMYV